MKLIRKTEKTIEQNYYVTFFVTFFMEAFCELTGKASLALANDHIGMMNLTSRLAGLDWRPVLGSCSYYGWGLQWLYTPLFLVSDNPYFIWYGYYIINFLIISFIAVLIYDLQVRYLNQEKNWLTILLSVAFASLTCLDYGKGIALILGIWGTTYIIFRTFAVEKSICRSKGQKILLSILCPLIVGYTKNFHELGIVLFVPLFILFLSDIIFRKKSVYLAPFIGTFITVYFVSNIIKGDVINWLTTYRTQTYLANTSALGSLGSYFFESWEAFKLFLYLLYSNFLSLDIWTYGFCMLGIVFVVFYCVNYKNKEYDLEKSTNQIVLIALSGLCACIVVGGVAMTWGEGLWRNASPTYPGKAYNFVDYYRYFGVPGMLGVISFFRSQKQLVFELRKILLGISLVRVIVFIKHIWPVLESETHTIIWDNTYLIRFFSQEEHLLNIVVWSILELLIIYLFCYRKEDYKYIILIVLMIFTAAKSNRVWLNWAYGNTDNYMDVPSIELRFCENAYGLVNAIDPSCILKDNIFFWRSGLSQDDYYYPYTLQFALNRYTIKVDDYDIEEAKLIFSTDPVRLIELDDMWIIYEIGENEYVAVSDIDIAKLVESYGTIVDRP